MTRSEHFHKLSQLRLSMPINDTGLYMEPLFIPWQGQVSALLSFNPKLKQDFQGAVASIDQIGTSTHELSVKRAARIIRIILEQAVSELELPEPEKESHPTPATAPAECLTDEHGFWWWLTHCTWPHRWQLLGFFISPFVLGAFLLGLKLGMMDEVKNLYVSFINPHASQSSNAATDNQPIKYPPTISAALPVECGR